MILVVCCFTVGLCLVVFWFDACGYLAFVMVVGLYTFPVAVVMLLFWCVRVVLSLVAAWL